MKTTIVYATNYGTTEKVANIIKSKLNGEVDIINVENLDKIRLDEIDNLIIGASVKIGQIQKSIKQWMTNNSKEIIAKKPYLYICAGEEVEEKINELFVTNFTRDILDSSLCNVAVGSEMIVSKLNFFEKCILRLVKGKLEDSSHLNMDAIDVLVNKIIS